MLLWLFSAFLAISVGCGLVKIFNKMGKAFPDWWIFKGDWYVLVILPLAIAIMMYRTIFLHNNFPGWYEFGTHSDSSPSYSNSETQGDNSSIGSYKCCVCDEKAYAEFGSDYWCTYHYAMVKTMHDAQTD